MGTEVARLNLPCTPVSLRPLLNQGRWNSGSAFWPKVTAEQKTAARAYLAELVACLTPAPRDRVLARVAVLLAHYYTPVMPEKMQEAVAEDWAEALSDLPWYAIKEAAGRWISTEDKRRPTPAAIRALAIEAAGHPWRHRAICGYIEMADLVEPVGETVSADRIAALVKSLDVGGNVR